MHERMDANESGEVGLTSLAHKTCKFFGYNGLESLLKSINYHLFILIKVAMAYLHKYTGQKLPVIGKHIVYA